MREPVWVGVDVGGTKVLAGIVGTDGTVHRTARRETPGRDSSVAALEDALTTAVHDVAGGAPIAGVGVAAAGFVDAEGERVMFAPHLPWQGEPVRSRLAERWGCPVALLNDANAAACAEARFGAGRHARDLLVVTLGTGIGGALVLDGRLHVGRNGMAGEFGHLQVVPDGRACPCGRRGCWEQYASGTALVRAAVGHGEGADPVTGQQVAADAAAGDPRARQAFAEVGRWLGAGLAGLVAAFDPDTIVVGGGASGSGELLLDPARRELARSVVGAGRRELPTLQVTSLGPAAGLVGAAVSVGSGQIRAPSSPGSDGPVGIDHTR